MTYDEIFDSLSQVFSSFFNEILTPFFNFILNTHLLSVGIMVSALPVVLVVINFFFKVSGNVDFISVEFKDKFFSVFNFTRTSVFKIQNKLLYNKRSESLKLLKETRESSSSQSQNK